MTGDAAWLDSMPEVYDRCLGPALFAPFAEHLATRVKELSPHRILELAAGTGIATAALAAALPDAVITATDLNPAMVAWAAARRPGTWSQANAQRLPFADDSYDLVMCQFGVMFFPDRPAAFAETARVLAPGATFLFAVWDVLETSPFPTALEAALAVVLPDDPPDFVARIPHGYNDPARIAGDVEQGGLRVEHIDRVVLQGSAPSAASLAEGYCYGTPLRFALEQRGPLEPLAAAVAEQMTARLGPGPVTGNLAAFVISARAI